MSEHSSIGNAYELCFRATQLRSLRKLRNISQERLAKEIGTDQANVSLIERAETKIEFSRLVDIARVLGARVIFDLEPKDAAPLQPEEALEPLQPIPLEVAPSENATVPEKEIAEEPKAVVKKQFPAPKSPRAAKKK